MTSTHQLHHPMSERLASRGAPGVSSSNVGRLGLLCLIGAIIGVVSALVTAFIPAAVSLDRYSYPYTPSGFVLAQLVFLLNHLLLLAGIIGLARSGAAGQSVVGRVGSGIAAAGMVVLSLCEVRALTLLNVAYPSPPTNLLDVFFWRAAPLPGWPPRRP